MRYFKREPLIWLPCSFLELNGVRKLQGWRAIDAIQSASRSFSNYGPLTKPTNAMIYHSRVAQILIVTNKNDPARVRRNDGTDNMDNEASQVRKYGTVATPLGQAGTWPLGTAKALQVYDLCRPQHSMIQNGPERAQNKTGPYPGP